MANCDHGVAQRQLSVVSDDWSARVRQSARSICLLRWLLNSPTTSAERTLSASSSWWQVPPCIVVSSESRRSIGASENAVSYRTRPTSRARHRLGGSLLGREIPRWWVIIVLSIAKTPTRPTRPATAAASFFATKTVADRSAVISSRGWTTPSFILRIFRVFSVWEDNTRGTEEAKISLASCVAGGTRTRRLSLVTARPVALPWLRVILSVDVDSVSSAYVYHFIKYETALGHTRLERIIHDVHTSQYTYIVSITFRSGIGHMRHDAPRMGERERERIRSIESRHAVGSLVWSLVAIMLTRHLVYRHTIVDMMPPDRSICTLDSPVSGERRGQGATIAKPIWDKISMPGENDFSTGLRPFAFNSALSSCSSFPRTETPYLKLSPYRYVRYKKNPRCRRTDLPTDVDAIPLNSDFKCCQQARIISAGLISTLHSSSCIVIFVSP